MKTGIPTYLFRFSAALMLAGMCTAAQADDLYGPDPGRLLTCEIKKGYQVADSGELEELWINPDEPSFTVDRETGEALGSGKISSHDSEATVIQAGIAEGGWSFEAIWVSERGGRRDVSILSIEVWSAGEEKPFIWTDSQFVYTGICS